jgi:diguanylate cyclase (GGDEF)-like protein/PAS domain S-box-containing protein
VIFTDPQTGEILAANPAACELVGASEEELCRLGRDGIRDPDDDARWDAALAEQARRGSVEAELSFRRVDGSTFVAEVDGSVFTDGAGAVRACAMLRDVTAERAAEAALRHSEHVLRQLIATSNDAFIAMDADGRIREWNRQAEVIFGWTAEEAIGRPLVNTIIPPSYRDAHIEGLAQYLATGDGTVLGQRLEVEGRRRDGTEFPVELTIWALGSGRDLSFNALLHDVSERRRAEEELWELALIDDLTGLHNRRAFVLLAEQAIKEAVRARRPVVGVFVDVDRLKHINDRRGHSEGDRALRLVAGALRAACRDADILGRLSGDEFAILLTDAAEVPDIEGRVRDRLAVAAGSVAFPLSVSIGLARCPPGQDCDLSELFERADQAMYEEKHSKPQADTPLAGPADKA